VRPNDHLVLVAFGGGLTWGATMVKWGVTVQPEVSRWHRLRRRALYELAKVRSAVRRGVRRAEGVVYGSQTPEGGQEPPHRK